MVLNFRSIPFIPRTDRVQILNYTFSFHVLNSGLFFQLSKQVDEKGIAAYPQVLNMACFSGEGFLFFFSFFLPQPVFELLQNVKQY